ncbi:Homocysteine S-methyltransferase 1 [Coelomomyces lativittatus]|nr:Homocysteine S-methyltransferase 1 [Coelomomyces lativittatus]
MLLDFYNFESEFCPSPLIPTFGLGSWLSNSCTLFYVFSILLVFFFLIVAFQILYSSFQHTPSGPNATLRNRYLPLPITAISNDLEEGADHYFEPSPILLSFLSFFIYSLFFFLFIDFVLLWTLRFLHNTWCISLILYNGLSFISIHANYLRLKKEAKEHFPFLRLTRGFWLLFFFLQVLQLSSWGYYASGSQKRLNIYPLDDYLFASCIMQCIMTTCITFSLLILHPLLKKKVQIDVDPHISNSEKKMNSFKETFEKCKKLFPYMMARGHKGLQVLMGLCIVVLFLGRFVVVLVPIMYKMVFNDLSHGVFSVSQIFLFVVARFLQSSFFTNLQTFMWIPIGQYTTRQVSLRMFSHLHSLSLRFHVSKKTGELLRILDRGTSSIVNLLQMLLFTLFPVVMDILIAIIYFIAQFDVFFGVIVLITMGSYILLTVALTEWRTKYRRASIDLDNQLNQVCVDSIMNFETVKYYNAEQGEFQRYDKAIQAYNGADFISSASLNLMNVTQGFLISLGLLAGSLLCGYRVVYGTLTIGDFALFYTYILQLYGPLNWFGTMYRVIQQNFTDMEKMLGLFNEHPDVQDLPDAKPLILTKGGQVEFQNVGFAYDGKNVLNNISFIVPAGQTVALVGPSGSGKSTLLRLLFRFYDVTEGAIFIDGQPIHSVTQDSLRKAIGIVPQDCVLFNETIFYNLRYARPSASEEEVYKAAQAAQIHEKILGFPKQYQTEVGERGLRLSGGERQRVAIARTILKDPKLILLDEATSSLDTQTERHIQSALNHLCHNRTTLVVAHRLSTIMHADLIVVMKDGYIIETGTHAELLDKNGLYHELWFKQLQAEKRSALDPTSDLGNDSTLLLALEESD